MTISNGAMRAQFLWLLKFGLLVILVVLIGLSACAPLKPYRTDQNYGANPSSTACTPDTSKDAAKFGTVPVGCQSLMTEQSADYDLDFAEFDDQGFPYFSDPNHVGLGSQIDDFLESVRSYAAFGGMPASADIHKGGSGGVSVVVFVHGWKHTSQSDDDNVKAFRVLLTGLSHVEKRSGCDRKVIGLYVGWRGAGTTLPDIFESTLTFWSRKNAALNVAQGSVRSVFSSLRAIEDLQNTDWQDLVKKAKTDRSVDARQPGNTCLKRMRLTVVGHSFGGLIVQSALSPSMVRDMAELREGIAAASKASPDRDPILDREGDLVVLINPAIEATRFDPLFRLSASTKTVNYHSPLFVSITSTDDVATREAFPLGRWIRSAFDKYPNGATRERSASLNTMGQDDFYITHTLEVARKATPAVKPDPRCEEVAAKPFSDRLKLEASMLQEFDHSLGDSRDANQEGIFPRTFCARHDPTSAMPNDYQLVLNKATSETNLNSPVWNIRTSNPILNSHGDISNTKLLDFLRQLYAEAENPGTALNGDDPDVVAAAK